jgi:hypothetical protein
MRTSVLLASCFVAAMASGQSISGAVGGTSGGGDGGLVGGLLVGAVNVLMHPEYFMNDEPVEHHRDIEARLFGGFGLAVQAPALTGSTGPARTKASLWPGLRTELGASFTYRDRLMLSLGGGWGISGYGLRVDTMVNSIYHSTKSAELRLAWHTLPQRNVTRQWSFGLGLGGTFQNADERSTDRNGFRSLTVAPQRVRPYIAPELGRITATGRDRYEMSLRYVCHLDPAPAWTNVSSYNGTTATAQASDDHLALMLRYHLGTRKTVEPLPVRDSIPVPAALDTLPNMACKRQRVTLKLWDDAEMDGDTVSVLLNGRPTLVAHCLQHKALKLRLDLDYGHNTLQVVAHNEGSIAPNTARGIIRRGKGREQLLIKTTRSRGEMLVLVRG